MEEKFIENGIEYVKCGDYYVPNLRAPTQQYQIGKYGKLHGKFIKEHHRAFYSILFMTGKWFEYLTDIDAQANEMVDSLVKQTVIKQGIDVYKRQVIGREPTRKQHVLNNFRTVYDAAPTASQTVGHAVGASQRFA